uniref:ATP synthase complex subunit 8 n=1 Tax=Acrobates pygmaeus TaxID=190720 RepID=A0A075QR61_ACRPY|nr:ATP synthase F0 subunit 8 [Acrobates pygmaeus]
MPQLNTSTWFFTILLMLVSLFCVYQLKMLNQIMVSISPQDEKESLPPAQLPWEKKWTKIYLPHSSPLQS